MKISNFKFQISKESFTIIEVLIFVTLISLIFITVSYITTLSLKNTKINENKILATHYADELREWLQGEKEVSWNSIVDKAGINPGDSSEWCVNTIPGDLSGLITNHCGLVYSLHNNTFKRDLTLIKNSDIQITIDILVEWKEANNTYKVPINTVLSLWE